MIELSLAEVAVAVNGQIYRGDPSVRISGLSSTDSREIAPGDIFFAKLGANDDGHRFLAEVFSKGAALAVVSEPSDAIDIAQIVVSDTVEALSALGGGGACQGPIYFALDCRRDHRVEWKNLHEEHARRNSETSWSHGRAKGFL